MKVVLIGSSGQLGKYLLSDLRKLGLQVLSPTKKQLNICTIDRIASYFRDLGKIDIIINAAAYHKIDDCESNWEEAFKINSMAVMTLSSLSKDMGARFITISTDYVFDGQKNRPYIETDLPLPLQVYGTSKLAGEVLAIAKNPDAIIIRTAGLYGGKGSSSKGGNFVINRISDSNMHDPIEVASNQFTSTTYAHDLSEAIVKMLFIPGVRGIYHLVNEGQVSWAEFTQEIYKIMDIKLIVKPVDRDYSHDETIRPLYSVLRNTRTAKLGITLPHWTNALKRYLLELN